VGLKAQMRWVRRNRRIAGWAALFAFALPITLSFGHIHRDRSAYSSPSAPAVSLARTASGDGAPNPDRPGANDFCAICATMGLVASSILPELSALSAPVATERGWLAEFTSPRLSFDQYILFQARAPPHVL
jgi:hypothetical protein